MTGRRAAPPARAWRPVVLIIGALALSAACGGGTPAPPDAAGPLSPAASATRPAPAAGGPAASPAGRAPSIPLGTLLPSRAATAPTTAAPGPQPQASPAGGGAPPSASGSWKRAFAARAGAIGCDRDFAQLTASDTPRLTFGRTTVFVGFQQYGNNQDPVFVRFDGATEVYCEHHEHQSPDGRALGITWDGGPTAYVVYSVVGGGTELDAKARGGWIDRYGDGGGSSAVTVLGQVELRFGTVSRASFVVARLNRDGQLKTNTISPAAAPLRMASGQVAVFAKSAFSPLNPDRTLMCVPRSEYPAPGPGRADGASYTGIFTLDLAGLTCASTWGCGNVRRPCPDLP